MYSYKDEGGHIWVAFIDERTREKRGRTEYASFTVLCPLPSYRSHVKIAKSSNTFHKMTAKEK